MINAGKKETRQMKDGWTVKTVDGQPSAHYEYVVAIDKGKANVLTTFEYIENVLYKGN
jgi:methionyl aminopeptidase